jgi:Berberine and berberine like
VVDPRARTAARRHRLELGAATGDTGFAAAAIVGGQGRLISPGTNFDRLVEVKETYDPENVFRSNRNMRPRARVGKAGAA